MANGKIYLEGPQKRWKAGPPLQTKPRNDRCSIPGGHNRNQEIY